MESLWWQLFDILGTAAFALSGALVAVSRRMDVFGMYVLAAVTAVGGGIVRDILIGAVPPAAFKTSLYLVIIVAAVAAAYIGIRYVRMPARQPVMQQLQRLYIVCDAIGLGSFTITGTLLGCAVRKDYWILAITLGILTAVGGGVIRDVLARRIPSVLREEVYATASLVGAAALYGLYAVMDVSLHVAAVMAFFLTVGLRLLAVRLHWNLPRIK